MVKSYKITPSYMSLPKNTFSYIPFWDIKQLVQKYTHPNILWTTDFIREYISSVLENTGKTQLSSENFYEIEKHFKSIDKIAHYSMYWAKKITLSTLEFLSWVPLDDELSLSDMREIIIFSSEWFLDSITTICTTPQNFKALYKDKDIRWSLQSADKEYIEIINTVCTSPEDFISLFHEKWIRDLAWWFPERLENLKIIVPFCRNIDDLKWVLTHENIWELIGGNRWSLQYFLKVIPISGIEDLISLLNQKVLSEIIRSQSKEQIEHILDVCDTTNIHTLVNLSWKWWIVDSLITSHSAALSLLMDTFSIPKGEGIIDVFNQYPDTVTTLSHSKTEILEFFISKFKISSIEQFSTLCSGENMVPILKWGKLENIERIIHFYKIDSCDVFVSFCKNIYFAALFSDEIPWEWLKKMIRICEAPEYLSLLLTSEAIFYTIKNGFPESILGLIENNDISKGDFFIFFKDIVSKSKDNARIILQNKIPYSQEFWEVFTYFLKYKKKSLVKFIEKLSTSYEYNLGIDITRLVTIEKLRTNDGESQIDFERCHHILWKMLQILWWNQKQHDSYLRRLSNAQSSRNIHVVEEIFAEVSMKYFEKMYDKKWKIKLKRELEILWDISEEKLNKSEFIEAYKMSVSPDHNKAQILKLLRDYLSGEFDDVSLLKQYKTERNIAWLENNLTPSQQKIWISSNIKEIDIWWNPTQLLHESSESVIVQRVENHFQTAVEKIKQMNMLGFSFQESFANSGELQKVFNMTIKKSEDAIKKRDTQNLFEDLKFQIESIQSLKQKKWKVKSTAVEKVMIQREHDPLKSLMMWNWVEGSCLSLYSTVWNYWSSISNTVDVNKGVYYIRDEKWELLWRCIITIGQDKKITRYKMYYAQNTGIDIDELFSDYTREIAEKMWLELNGSQYQVEDIEGEKWYKDGEVKV